MRNVAKDLLQLIDLFLLFLDTGIEQGKEGNMGNRRILWYGRGPWRQTLQVGLGTFAIEVVQNIDELLANKRCVRGFPALFGRMRPVRDLLDILRQPNAQATL